MSETSLASVDRAVQIPGVEVSRLGLVIDPNLSREEMATVFACLNRITGCSNWLWGDALAFAGNKWGNAYYRSKYEDANVRTGLAIPTLKAAKYTAEHIPMDRRRPQLTYSHHCEIAFGYSDPAEQDRWLDRAIEERWSVPQLRKAIRLDKQEIHEEPNPEPGKYEPIRAYLSFMGWLDRQDVSAWPPDQVRAWIDDLHKCGRRCDEKRDLLIATLESSDERGRRRKKAPGAVRADAGSAD